MKIVGHRGAAAHEPENTMRSFAKAYELGCRAVEFDVQMTADGRLAVIHDDTVDRTTNGVGRVADLTLDDIQRLKTDGGEKVPSLDQVIDWADALDVFLHVEIKDRRAVKATVDLLMARGLVGRCRVSSFWHIALVEARGICPDLDLGVLYAGSPLSHARLAKEVGARALHPNWKYVTAEMMAEAKENRLSVLAWTVDHAKDFEAMAALGVDEVVSNRPDVGFKVLKELAERKDAPPREKTAEEKRMDAERAEIQKLMKQKPGEEGPRKPGKKPGW